MISGLKRRVYGLGRFIPVWLCRLFIKRDVVAFYYHVVSDQSLAYVKNLYPYKSVAMFERDLIYLRRNFSLLSYDELVRYRADGVPLPPNSAVISCDDGYSECFSVMRPLLLKHRVPWTFFVTTGFIDNQLMFFKNKASLCVDQLERLDAPERAQALAEIEGLRRRRKGDSGSLVDWILSLNHSDVGILDEICETLEIDIAQTLESHSPYLSADQVRSLANDGFTIGAHSRSHPHLGQLSDYKALEDEIVESCRTIQEISGQTTVPFAFPFSGEGVPISFLEELVSEHDFMGLMFGTAGLRKDRDFVINRVGLDTPPDGSSRSATSSNVPKVTREMYQRQFVWNVLHVVIRLAERITQRAQARTNAAR